MGYKAIEGKHYLRNLPDGIKYPDDDPQIMELKRKQPDVLWDRYIPSELALEQMVRLREELEKKDPKTAAEIEIPDLPPGTWVYNATWELETAEDRVLDEVCERLETLLKERGVKSE
jgi:hypothetical protein